MQAFYPSYENALEASLSQTYRGEGLTEGEKEFWRETYAEVEKPFRYGYYGGWKSMLNISSWSLFIIYAVSVALSPMFAGGISVRGRCGDACLEIWKDKTGLGKGCGSL